MFRPWHCTLSVTTTAVTILVQDNNRDLLKAQLHPQPNHPRALLTLLEGVSLWRGQPLQVALSVAEHCHPGPCSMLLNLISVEYSKYRTVARQFAEISLQRESHLSVSLLRDGIDQVFQKRARITSLVGDARNQEFMGPKSLCLSTSLIFPKNRNEHLAPPFPFSNTYDSYPSPRKLPMPR